MQAAITRDLSVRRAGTATRIPFGQTCCSIRKLPPTRIIRLHAEPASSGSKASESHRHASKLARVLNVSQTVLMIMVDQAPSVFHMEPDVMEVGLGLGMTIAAIADLLGLQTCQVPALLYAQPKILLQPDILKENFRNLGFMLGLPPSEISQMVIREPLVLSLSPEQAQQRMGSLCEALSCTPMQLSHAIAQWPELLLQESGSVSDWVHSTTACCEALLSSKVVSTLKANLGLITKEQQQEQQRQQAEEDKASKQLPPLLQDILRAKPSLMNIPGDIIASRLMHFYHKCHEAGSTRYTSIADVVRSLAAGPDSLAVTSCHLDRRASETASVIHLQNHTEYYEMLLSQPELLSTSATVLSHKLMLVDQSLVHEDTDAIALLKLGDVGFRKQYPTYAKWLAS
eukprot:gene15931-22065_t